MVSAIYGVSQRSLMQEKELTLQPAAGRVFGRPFDSF
jgi:hypothetical protein